MGIEQKDRIKTNKVFERLKDEVSKMVKMFTSIKLYDVNLVCAVNTRVIPETAYPINMCKFAGEELKELDQVINRELNYVNKLWYGTNQAMKYCTLEEKVVKRNKIVERHLQKDEAESRLPHNLLRKQVDQRCIEKREHQGLEFYIRKNNEDNGRRWSRNPILG